MTPGLTLKSVLLATLVVVGSATAADAPKIAVTNVDKIVGPGFLGDQPVKFAPAAQISNVGILAGQVKKIRLHTHELEDHVVYVVRGQGDGAAGGREARGTPGRPHQHPEARAVPLRAKGRRALRDPRQRDSGLATAQRHEVPGVAASRPSARAPAPRTESEGSGRAAERDATHPQDVALDR